MTREHRQSIAVGVPGQVDQDVDAIAPYQLGK